MTARTAVSQTLMQRLALYRRYASVVEEQESALQEGDWDRFSELNLTRANIEAEVESVRIPPVVPPGADALRLIEEAVETLRSTDARHARIQERLTSLRREVAGEIQQVRTRRGNLRAYLQEDAGRPGIDVKS
ncbi:MAG: hypothetical protein HKO53_15925 [Gemmatimonadetes bacterium]|nr:hypothetical protein [Gemmatimonadota bacterium]